ncbi:esterase-like activity of phytase family protein [Mangrovicoccus algicola]|uniref:Esterase-like activity of phytase family protein n=1 Tax=Mangrovicoccus algicola TaxID=2771008 RepID=A0A8J6YYV3_9RHOB|nr:esterase-like activity of phytase family protein [Mangrovicoccus algicola]MBE3640120.1 esterase-like activity of phytase family protein [Mangrovicoccus algicola]
MNRRLCAALAAALMLSGGPGPAADPVRLVSMGDFTWNHPEAFGLSAIEVSADGMDFITVSDRGHRIDGRFRREAGRIVAVEMGASVPLKKTDGTPATGNAMDAEGLACAEVAPGAACDVSFEMIHRVAHFTNPQAAARNRPRPAEFRSLQMNSGLEALAIDDQGRLVAIPERSGELDRPFPVYRLEGGRWRVPFTLRRDPPFLPVGADFGPDGRLYVLERHFTGFAFQSRVRRLTPEGDRVAAEETLLTSLPFQHDNLEGIAVWRDETGAIRLTMISDDNQNVFQKTEIVEYRLAE